MFTTLIADNNRVTMSLLPCRTSADGDAIPCSADELVRHSDQMAVKSRAQVRLKEQLDDYEYDGTTTQFVLSVVSMPNKADLNIILDAARHMGLIDRYAVEQEYRDELSEIYEKIIYRVRFSLPSERIFIDEETPLNHPVYLPWWQRRECWTGLFNAAGYRVSWNNIYNVRRQKL